MQNAQVSRTLKDDFRAVEKQTCCPIPPLALRAASSGGTGRGLAPGMGSDMGMPGWWAPGAMVPAAPLICWARNMARSGSLLGSAHACCHTGTFWDKSSFPCRREGGGPGLRVEKHQQVVLGCKHGIVGLGWVCWEDSGERLTQMPLPDSANKSFRSTHN